MHQKGPYDDLIFYTFMALGIMLIVFIWKTDFLKITMNCVKP